MLTMQRWLETTAQAAQPAILHHRNIPKCPGTTALAVQQAAGRLRLPCSQIIGRLLLPHSHQQSALRLAQIPHLNIHPEHMQERQTKGYADMSCYSTLSH